MMLTGRCQRCQRCQPDDRKHTILSQFGPDTINTRQVGLTAKTSFGTDLFGQMGDLTRKLLQLVHHAIDGTLEGRNLWIALLGIDQDLFAEIAICDSRDDTANLAQHFLISEIDLLVLGQLALQSLDIVHGVADAAQDDFCSALLLLYLCVGRVYVGGLLLDHAGLVLDMIAETIELCFGQLPSGGVGIPWLGGGEQLVDP